jgi:hypothetical protein
LLNKVGKSGTKALASTGGANTVTSTGNVGGSTANATLSEAQLASHAHNGFTAGGISGGSPRLNVAPSNLYGNTSGPAVANTGSGSGHSHNMSANFSGDATSVLQPYLTIIYIIKT